MGIAINPAIIKAQEQQAETILNVLAKRHPLGMTIKELQAAIKSVLGYMVTAPTLRHRVYELVEAEKCYESIQRGKYGAAVFIFGTEPKPEKKDFGTPSKSQAVALPSTVFQYLERIERKCESLDKKVRSLLVRSEYNTSAMIAIKKVADELGVQIPDLKNTDE